MHRRINRAAVLLSAALLLSASPGPLCQTDVARGRGRINRHDHLLFQAARSGDTAQVRYRIAMGADPNAQDAAGQTPLMLAAEQGHLSVVRLLLTHRANPFLRRRDGQTALSLAIRSHHMPIAEVVAVAQSDPEVAVYQRGTPLVAWAALFGDMAAVQALVARGADLTGAVGGEALAMAAGFGQTEVIQYLLAHGADINTRFGHGMTVLMAAASSPRPRQETLITLLRDKGAKIDVEDASGKTALLYAAASGDLETVRVLVDRGANVGHKDRQGETAANLAAQSGTTDPAIVLLLQRAATHTQGQGHRQELVAAVGKDDLTALSDLLAQGGNVNSRNDTGDTLLMMAAKQGSLPIVQFLLRSGADVAARSLDYWHYTALARAAEAGHADVVEALLVAGADPNAKIAEGYTALARATMTVRTTMVEDSPSEQAAAMVAQSLLHHGANPNGVDDQGETELDQAALYGVTAVAAVLLDHGAKINARVKGITALGCAVQNGWPETVKLLVVRGANVNLPDEDGKRPLAVAYEQRVHLNAEGTRRYNDIIATLKAAGAVK